MKIRPVAAELFHADELTKQDTHGEESLCAILRTRLTITVNDGLRGRVAYRTTCTPFR
jgi:hypothetical protein